MRLNCKDLRHYAYAVTFSSGEQTYDGMSVGSSELQSIDLVGNNVFKLLNRVVNSKAFLYQINLK